MKRKGKSMEEELAQMLSLNEREEQTNEIIDYANGIKWNWCQWSRINEKRIVNNNGNDVSLVCLGENKEDKRIDKFD